MPADRVVVIAVPRAAEQALLDGPLAEWAALVRTMIVQRPEALTAASEGHRAAVDLDRVDSALVRHVGVCDPMPLCRHRPSSRLCRLLRSPWTASKRYGRGRREETQVGLAGQAAGYHARGGCDMSPEEIAALLLGLPEVTEEEPFAPGLPVFKVAGKVFAIYQPDPPEQITLKCDAARALHLRDEYPAIVPGYHVNKRLWNTISLDGSVPDDLLDDPPRPARRRGAAGRRA